MAIVHPLLGVPQILEVIIRSMMSAVPKKRKALLNPLQEMYLLYIFDERRLVTAGDRKTD